MAKHEIDSRFMKFGTVSFAAVTQVNDFIGYLESGKIVGSKCLKCGQSFFPPRAHCNQCLSNEMEWFDVDGAGKLVSYSTLQYAPTGFSEELPYTIALLAYEKYKIFGRIDRSIPEADIALGMHMKTVVSRTCNNQLTYVFQKA